MMRRGVSNPRKTQGSTILENETGKMEEKLKTLKQAMEKQKDQREDNMRTSGSRWKAAATNMPLKNYAAKVIDKKTQPGSSQGSSSARSSILKSDTKQPSQIQLMKTLPLSRPNSSRQSATRNGKENKISLNNSLWKTQEQTQPQSDKPPSSSSSSSLVSSRKSIEISAGRPPSSSFSLRPGSVKSQTSSIKQKVNTENSSLDMSSSQRDEDEEIFQKDSSQKIRKPMVQTKLNELMTPSKKQNTKEQVIQHQGETSVESNILKHLAFQKEIQKEVHQFLATLNLTQYRKVFEENGFDDLETIEEISTEYMNSMKIPAAHQIKIMKRIEVLKQEKKEVEELHRKKDLKDSVSESESESSKIKNIVLYPKKEAPKQIEKVIAPQQNKPDQIKKVEESSESSAGGELLKGTFDEQESHNSFLEALMQFRGQKKLPEEQIVKETENVDGYNQKKGVRFAEDVADNEGKCKIGRKIKVIDEDDGTIRGSVSMIVHPPEENENVSSKPVTSFFFYSTGDNQEWSNADYPSSQDAGIETANPARLPKRDIHKISCYQCYKLVEVGTEKTMNIKNFCSDKCLASYQGISQVKCECGKSVLKEDCCFVRAKWYCSESCALGITSKEKEEQTKNDQNSVDEGDDDIIDLEFGMSDKTIMTLDALENKYKKMRQSSTDRQNKSTK